MSRELYEGTQGIFGTFNIMFIITFIIAIGIFVLVFSIMFSPKVRSKIIGRQLKATKMMLDDNKETIKEIHNLQADIAVSSTDEILDKHEGTIKKNMTRVSEMSADSIENAARAIKKGLDSKTKKCPKCSKYNDEHAKFCQECGAKFKD